MVVRGAKGHNYQLESKPFSSGGEGDVYGVIGAQDKVIKIYHAGRSTGELEHKLLRMAKYPPSSRVLSQVAWPLDVVYDTSNQFCGFVMPRLSITAELNEVYVYPPKTNMTLQQKLVIAQNICVVISEVHKAGYVFGDFNPRNIGINTNTGTVAFLDTDTYHIVVDKSQNKAYRCNVCAPGYAAPELLERCGAHIAAHPEDSKQAYAKTPLDTFTKETDYFALAIHIFKLLMNGFTPFNGIKETETASVGSPGVGDTAVRRDSYCFKPGNKPQSAAVPPLESLPQEIAELFTRAFMYGKIDPKQRPTALEWHAALSRYESSLKQCRANPTHLYLNTLTTCPWCEADRRYAAATARPLSQKTYQTPVVMPSTPVSTSNSTVTTSSKVNQSSYNANAGGSTYIPPVPSTPPQTQSKKSNWYLWAVAVVALILFISFVTKDRDTITIESRDPIVSVGQTTRIAIKSTAPQLTASYPNNIELEWDNAAAHDDYYYIDIVGLYEGQTTVTISKQDNKSISDSITFRVLSPSEYAVAQQHEDEYSGTEPLDGITALIDVNTFYEDSHLTKTESSFSDNVGNNHEWAISATSSDKEGSVVYLNDGYSSFQGSIVIDNYSKSCSDCGWVKIYGDDELIFDSGRLGKGTMPIDFDLDVSPYDQIKLVFREGDVWYEYQYRHGYIVDAYFIDADAANGQVLRQDNPDNMFNGDNAVFNTLSLVEARTFYEEGGISTTSRTIKDNVGNYYDGGSHIYSSSGKEGSAVYLTEGYARFVGRIIVEYPSRSCSDCGWIKIYGDDELLFETGRMGKGVFPVDFDLDISPYSQITITSREGDDWYEYDYRSCYLVDTFFISGEEGKIDSFVEKLELPHRNDQEGRKTISILDADTFYEEGGVSTSTSTKTDNYGTKYDGSMHAYGSEKEGSGVYLVEGYSRLYGRVIIDQYGDGCSDCGWVKIFGDDTLIFDSGVMGSGSSPVDFDLDITAYNQIKITFREGSDWYDYEYHNCYLVDTYFAP